MFFPINIKWKKNLLSTQSIWKEICQVHEFSLMSWGPHVCWISNQKAYIFNLIITSEFKHHKDVLNTRMIAGDMCSIVKINTSWFIFCQFGTWNSSSSSMYGFKMLQNHYLKLKSQQVLYKLRCSSNNLRLSTSMKRLSFPKYHQPLGENMSQYSDTAAFPKMSVNLQELSIQHHRTTMPQVQRLSDCSVFQRNTLSSIELFYFYFSDPAAVLLGITSATVFLAHSCCFYTDLRVMLGDRVFSDVCLNPLLAFLLVARCTLVSPFKFHNRLHWNIAFSKWYLNVSLQSHALFCTHHLFFFMQVWSHSASVCTVQYSLFQLFSALLLNQPCECWINIFTQIRFPQDWEGWSFSEQWWWWLLCSCGTFCFFFFVQMLAFIQLY